MKSGHYSAAHYLENLDRQNDSGVNPILFCKTKLASTLKMEDPPSSFDDFYTEEEARIRIEITKQTWRI